MRSRLCHAAGLLLILAVFGTGPAPAQVTFIAPPSHASFSVRLLWLKHLNGRFGKLYGSLSWQPQRHAGIVRAWVDVHSAHMNKPRFRELLLGPGFLDVARYPRIAFVSRPVELHTLRNGGRVRGNLTLHGVTRLVDFTVQPSACDKPDVMSCTLRLHGSVKRKTFGMTAHNVIVSNRVELNLVIVLQLHDD